MPEPALKYEAILVLKLLIAFKMAYSCCFSLGEIQIFQNSSTLLGTYFGRRCV